MPRDDAGEGREGGSWDFDLPDLGASTTPDHHRRRGTQPTDEPGDEQTGSGAPPSSPPDDDLLPAWASGRRASTRRRHQRDDEVDDRRTEPTGRGATGAAAAGEVGNRSHGYQDDGSWDDRPGGDAPWDDGAEDDGPRGGQDREDGVRGDEAWDDEDRRDGRRPWWQGLAIRREGVIRALVGLAVLMLIIVLAVMAFGGRAQDAAEDDPAVVSEASEEDPFAGFTPRPSQEAADGASGPAARACGDELSIRSSTDESSYGSDEDPVLIMTLENTGEDPCTVNAGTARMDFTVSSGSDTVFDSQHCQVEGQDRPIELDPGETESARMAWDRERSSAGCPEDTGQVPAGGYEFRALLGEVSGDPAEFTLQ